MNSPTALSYPRLDADLHEKLCHVLLEIRIRFPDLRLGQLIANLASFADSDVWGVEDWDLLPAAEAFLERHRDRLPDLASAPSTGAA